MPRPRSHAVAGVVVNCRFSFCFVTWRASAPPHYRAEIADALARAARGNPAGLGAGEPERDRLQVEIVPDRVEPRQLDDLALREVPAKLRERAVARAPRSIDLLDPGQRR